MNLWQYEQEAGAAGYRRVCGCDEAGAGPLAGPVYAAAVILPWELELPGLDDSKKLTEKKREALFPLIQERALAWAVAWVDAAEIDETDILSARMKAMQLAMDQLEPPADFALVDGNRDRGRSSAIVTPHRCIVKGDSLSASIAAASILAKVSRDRLDGEGRGGVPGVPVPEAQGLWDQAPLRDAKDLRPQPHPPPVLFKEAVSGEESRRRGRWGEELAARYLEGKGYRITARRWRCRFGELDLVAERGGFLCFVEVKLRRSARYRVGGGVRGPAQAGEAADRRGALSPELSHRPSAPV